jgi:hypothetical protein
MAFTLQDIEQLRGRSGDWDVVWGRLWEELDLRLHQMLFFGMPNDPSSWKLKPRFNILREESTAQDFISDLLFDFARRADQGTLLVSFKGSPEQLLPFLAAPDFVGRRAIDHLVKTRQQGIINLPSDCGVAPTIHRMDGEGFDVADEAVSRDDDDPLRFPLRLEFRAGGSIGATIRMAATQCWPRLPADQAGLEQLESDLRDRLFSSGEGDPISSLESVHGEARLRLVHQLVAIDDQIVNTPGMHDPRRVSLDMQRVKIQVELLLVPLDREALQSLMTLSDDAIFQQVRRYKQSFSELFPDLEERLDALVRGSR